MAYKYVMAVAMVTFVNHYAPRLNLPIAVPLKGPEIQKLTVPGPIHMKALNLYGGILEVDHYRFYFRDREGESLVASPASAFSIVKLEEDGLASFGIPLQGQGESSVSLMERASLMPYTATTNQLCLIATNDLMALDIDRKAIETKNPLAVEQPIFHSDHGLVPSPLMYVYWGTSQLRETGSGGVAFEISAVSGDLLELNAGKACGCQGLPLLKEPEKLLAISDREFLEYSTLERSNLLVQFAGIHYNETNSFFMDMVTAPDLHTSRRPPTLP